MLRFIRFGLLSFLHRPTDKHDQMIIKMSRSQGFVWNQNPFKERIRLRSPLWHEFMCYDPWCFFHFAFLRYVRFLPRFMAFFIAVNPFLQGKLKMYIQMLPVEQFWRRKNSCSKVDLFFHRSKAKMELF